MSDIFDGADIIFAYTRAQAIIDGVLIDATLGDLGEISRQHVGPTHVAMTAGLFALIKEAVENTKYHNDWKGVWHDILWMSRPHRHQLAKRMEPRACNFTVIITGTGRKKNHILQVHLGPDDHGRPCWTYMLDGED